MESSDQKDLPEKMSLYSHMLFLEEQYDIDSSFFIITVYRMTHTLNVRLEINVKKLVHDFHIRYYL